MIPPGSMTVGPVAPAGSAPRTRRNVSKKLIGSAPPSGSTRFGPVRSGRSSRRRGLRGPVGLGLLGSEMLEDDAGDLGAEAVPRVVGHPPLVLVLVGQDADSDRPPGTLDDPRRGPGRVD